MSRASFFGCVKSDAQSRSLFSLAVEGNVRISGRLTDHSLLIPNIGFIYDAKTIKRWTDSRRWVDDLHCSGLVRIYAEQPPPGLDTATIPFVGLKKKCVWSSLGPHLRIIGYYRKDVKPPNDFVTVLPISDDAPCFRVYPDGTVMKQSADGGTLTPYTPTGECNTKISNSTEDHESSAAARKRSSTTVASTTTSAKAHALSAVPESVARDQRSSSLTSDETAQLSESCTTVGGGTLSHSGSSQSVNSDPRWSAAFAPVTAFGDTVAPTTIVPAPVTATGAIQSAVHVMGPFHSAGSASAPPVPSLAPVVHPLSVAQPPTQQTMFEYSSRSQAYPLAAMVPAVQALIQQQQLPQQHHQTPQSQPQSMLMAQQPTFNPCLQQQQLTSYHQHQHPQQQQQPGGLSHQDHINAYIQQQMLQQQQQQALYFHQLFLMRQQQHQLEQYQLAPRSESPQQEQQYQQEQQHGQQNPRAQRLESELCPQQPRKPTGKPLFTVTHAHSTLMKAKKPQESSSTPSRNMAVLAAVASVAGQQQ